MSKLQLDVLNNESIYHTITYHSSQLDHWKHGSATPPEVPKYLQGFISLSSKHRQILRKFDILEPELKNVGNVHQKKSSSVLQSYIINWFRLWFKLETLGPTKALQEDF